MGTFIKEMKVYIIQNKVFDTAKILVLSMLRRLRTGVYSVLKGKPLGELGSSLYGALRPFFYFKCDLGLISNQFNPI